MVHSFTGHRPDSKRYIWDRLNNDKEFRKRLWALKGMTLGCFCNTAPCNCDVIKAWIEAEGPYMQGKIIMYMGQEPNIDKMFDIKGMAGAYSHVEGFCSTDDGNKVEVVYVYGGCNPLHYDAAIKWARKHGAPILFEAPHNMEDAADFVSDLNKWQNVLGMNVNEFMKYIEKHHNMHDFFYQGTDESLKFFGNKEEARFYIQSKVLERHGYPVTYHCWYINGKWYAKED